MRPEAGNASRVLKALACAALALLLAPPAAGQRPGPEELVREVTLEVLGVLQAMAATPDLSAEDRKNALAIAQWKVTPHVDIRHATQLALGEAWPAASAVQREQLVREFRVMLVRVYTSWLGAYHGQLVRVLPATIAPEATEATVRNRFLMPGNPAVPVDYAMRLTPEGWKIHDVVIDGVSLVRVYRAEFEVIVRRSGLEGLVRRLAEKNGS